MPISTGKSSNESTTVLIAGLLPSAGFDSVPVKNGDCAAVADLAGSSGAASGSSLGTGFASGLAVSVATTGAVGTNGDSTPLLSTFGSSVVFISAIVSGRASTFCGVVGTA